MLKAWPSRESRPVTCSNYSNSFLLNKPKTLIRSCIGERYSKVRHWALSTGYLPAAQQLIKLFPEKKY